MDSNYEHDRSSASSEQEDFVATALLALKQGPSTVPSLNSSGTSKDDLASSTQDVNAPAAAAATTAAPSTREPSILPLQPPLSAPDDHANVPLNNRQQDLANVSPQRLYNAKFIHPAATRSRHQIPQQQLRGKMYHLPVNDIGNHRGKGIIQRRFFSNMKNINTYMEYRPQHNMKYHHPVIVVPPARPFQQTPAQVAPHQTIYMPVYGANVSRRVSDAATTNATAAATASTHSRSFHTTSNDDDNQSGSNENNVTVCSIKQNNSASGQIQMSSSRNGGPLSQIYNEHRKNTLSFHHPIPQHQAAVKQPPSKANTTVNTATTTQYDNTPPQAPTSNKKQRTAPSRLPRHIAEYLKRWMDTNIDYPYPSDKEKEMMMYDTGIDRKRLDVWLRNNRNRYVKVKRAQSSVGGLNEDRW